MTKKPTSVLFFGTPPAAVPCFQALLGDSSISLVGVVTQPDRPSGRGQNLAPSPVKVAAMPLGLPILQPESLKGITIGENGTVSGTAANDQFVEFLNSQPAIDLFVVVAFGQIIPRPLINLPPCGIINVHFSLLPRWRGAAPIQRAIAAGDRRTGVSIMRIEPGLDTGPVYAVREIPINLDSTFGTIHDSLANIGAELLRDSIPRIISGELTPHPQPETGATHAAKWEKADMQIRWNDPARVTVDRIRASSPFWGGRTMLASELVKIFSAGITPIPHSAQSAESGTVVAVNRAEIVVRSGDGAGVAITELQFPGKRKMPAKEYLAGHPVPIGTRFEDLP